jgi:MFS family permease
MGPATGLLRKEPQMHDFPRVWNRRRPINYPKQTEMAGGIAAPLLVGFSLTTVAQLVIGQDHPWLFEYGIAMFAIAAVLLVNTVQFSATALGYAATPSDRLDYNPESALVPDILRIVRQRQWEEMELRAKYTSRALLCYNYGLLAFLAGLGLIIVPHHSWPWPWGQFIGVVVVCIALITEGAWIFSAARWPKWLLPTSSTKIPDPLEDEGAEYLFAGREATEVAANLRKCVELLEIIASRK